MAVLNEAQRKASATIGKDRYPIPDKAHARVALARINQGGLSPSQKSKVRAKAHRVLYGRKGTYSKGAVAVARSAKR